MRAIYLTVGLALVGVGFVGYAVPGLPSTVFLIMALFCFKKSSPRFERWLLGHRVFGPTLRDWDEHRTIRPRTKVAAIATMWLFVAVSVVLIRSAWVASGIVALALFGTWYIATRSSCCSESRVVSRES